MNNREFIHSWFDCQVNGREVRRHRCGNLCSDGDAVYSYGPHFPLARLCENGFLLNGERYSITTSTHQSLTRSVCMAVCESRGLRFVVIPFTVLNRAWLIPAEKIEIVDKTDEQSREVEYTDQHGHKRIRTEHLLGGSVIRYGSRHFLSSIDPTATWGRGYFLTELSGPASTVEEALESLKPEAVRQLEEKTKRATGPTDLILRQGEWFFVKVGQIALLTRSPSCKRIGVLEKTSTRNGYLPSGDSAVPHHRATRLVSVGAGECGYGGSGQRADAGSELVPGMYCRGTVRHDNREHRMLKLGNGREWFPAIRNRQVRSWSYDGRVD